MWRRSILLLAAVGLCVLMGTSSAVWGTSTLGFGVGVPPALPVNWNASFSFLSAEILADSNLSFLLTLGAYPADFPNRYEASGSLLVKAWIGPVALYGGGGISLQWTLISNAWLWSPFMNVMTGAQLWVIDSFALSVQARSLDPLPATFTLNPEISLGANIALGKARPSPSRLDGDYLWLLVGLGVFALLSYYPRS